MSRPRVEARGPLDAEVLVLADQPGPTDHISRAAFPETGDLYGFLARYMVMAGLNPVNMRYACCLPDRLPKEAVPTAGDMARNCDRLTALMDEMPNLKLVLAIGGGTNWALQYCDSVDRGQPLSFKPEAEPSSKITAVHGVEWRMARGVWVMPIYSVFYVQRRLNLIDDLVQDLTRCVNILNGMLDHVRPTHYKELRTPEDCAMLFKKLRKHKHFVFDSETTTVQFPGPDDRILCLQFSWAAYSGVYLPIYENPLADYPWEEGVTTWKDIPPEALVRKRDLKNYWVENYGEDTWSWILSELKDIFEDYSISKTGHNIKFDARFLWVCFGIKTRNYAMDTMNAHSLLNQDAKHDLKTLSHVYTDLGLYDRELDAAKKVVTDAVDRANAALLREWEKAKEAAYQAYYREVNPDYAEWCDRYRAVEKKTIADCRKEFDLRASVYPTNRRMTLDADAATHAAFWKEVDRRVRAEMGTPPSSTPDAMVKAMFDETYNVPKPELLEFNYSHLPLKALIHYACKDVDATIRLEHRFRHDIDAQGKLRFIHDMLLMHLLPALVEAEVLGVAVDRPRMERAAQEMRKAVVDAEASVRSILMELRVPNPNIDVASSSQLSNVLFDVLKLPVIAVSEKTHNPSTGKDVIYALKRDPRVLSRPNGSRIVELLTAIETYRRTSQLNSTFIEGLLEKVASDGKLHPNFKMTRDEEGKGTATGRLSTGEPNLLNIPRDDKDNPNEVARFIRQQFIPHTYPSGRGVFVDRDLSQAEVRVGGSVSHDETLYKLFDEGTDIHSFVASQVPMFGLQGLSLDDIKTHHKAKRTQAKGALFGTMYGQGAYGLAAHPEFNLTQDEAAEIINTIFTLMPGFARWMDETKAFVVRHGYVETPWGRRRWLRNAQAPRDTKEGRKLVAAAQRQAVNSVVQSHASDYCLLAFALVWANLNGYFAGVDHRFAVTDGICKATGKPFVSREVLIVHDAIIVSCPVEEAEEVDEIVGKLMSIDMPTHWIPMKSDGDIVDIWSGRKVDCAETMRCRSLPESDPEHISKESYIYREEKQDG
jgi:DNA polymerase I-like protein with 3'-5' exonuclease and polymerase domains/uracil-DNA glycosylase